MTGFMAGEISEIQQEEARAIEGCVEQEQEVERDGDDCDRARDGFPVIEGDGGPSHAMRVTARKSCLKEMKVLFPRRRIEDRRGQGDGNRARYFARDDRIGRASCRERV